MKAMNIGTSFTFFLAMSIKKIGHWPILAYLRPIFGPELETSQLLLHTIAMKAMRIGSTFNFFLAMSVEAVANWLIFGQFLACFWPNFGLFLALNWKLHNHYYIP